MSSRISRRSFLKSLSLLPLSALFNGRLRLLGDADTLSQDPERPNVFVFVFDALSAKHMSLYGYNRETTPNLDRLAERATVYHAHHAGGNYTTPGTSSLLTGAYSWSHRLFNVFGTYAEPYTHRSLFRIFAEDTYNRISFTNNWTANMCLCPFREDVDVFLNPGRFSVVNRTLSDRLFPNDTGVAYRAERFLLRGIRVAGSAGVVQQMPGALVGSLVESIIGDAHSEQLTKEYADLYPRGLPSNGTAFFLLEHVIDGLGTLMGNLRQPTFGYFHSWPPHSPYNPRREFVGRFDDGWVPMAKEPHFFSQGWSDEYLNNRRRQYDESIAHVDAEFGRLFDLMDQSGILDTSYVVFTSDHGEMFERGIREHSTPVLYEPLVRIPLLIFKPKQRQREDVYAPTSCIDLAPTLFQVTGQAVPDWCEGEVLPTFGGKEASSGRSVFSVEAKRNYKFAPLTMATVALVKDRHKLIHYFGYSGYDDEYELYDLQNDPEEVENLYSSSHSLAAELRNELEEKLHDVNKPFMAE